MCCVALPQFYPKITGSQHHAHIAVVVPYEFECECVPVYTLTRVWSSLPKRALPSGVWCMCRNIQVSLLFKRLPLYPLFVCFSKTSIFSVDNKRTVAVGREAEAERRTRERNRGFKEGKWEEKRREKSPLNSDHCLDVKRSWSRFCWHRSQQIKSAWTEWGERERYWETEGKTKITNFNIDTYRQTRITQKNNKNKHQDKETDLAWVGKTNVLFLNQ